MDNESVLASGLVDRVGMEGMHMVHIPTGKEKVKVEQEVASKAFGFEAGIKMILDALIHHDYGVIADLNEVDAVGHRIVQGGAVFKGSVLVDEKVIEEIRNLIPLAPLHNAAHIKGIEAVKKIIPNIPMVVVFDTAFHQTMPPEAYMYAVPYELYEQFGVRRYGFHGTSHYYVAYRAAEIIGKPVTDLKIVTCHLGNGASMAAVKGGKSVDTSMGLTPLEGLVMGSRSGDIDPAVVSFIMRHKGVPLEEIDNYLNRKCGILGVSGISSDLRDVDEAAAEGNERAILALNMYAYKARKTIGSYAAAMGGIDALVFTAGIGENYIAMRAKICQGLEFLGIEIDPARNNVRRKEQIISKEGARVTVLVVPTNEELVIARDTKRIVMQEGLLR